jgi:LacI family transcriptional regulator
VRKPRSADVAKLAGVSQASVSLILNNSEKISFSLETRERVFAAAKELGYELPERKKRLRAGGRILLVFTPTLTNYYYPELIQYVETYATTLGYHVIVCNTFRRPRLEQYYLDTMVTNHVAGLIYTFLPNFPDTVNKIATTIPAVIIGEKQEELNLCSIELNNLSAAAMLTEHLYQLGHRRFAYFSTPFRPLALARTERLEGIRRHLKTHDIDDCDVLVSEDEEIEYDPQGAPPHEYVVGRQLAARYLRENGTATAWIAVNDMTALSLLAELSAQGYRVPEDISVCGFDNIFMSGLCTPPLTTIDHYLRSRCQAAIDMIADRSTHAPLLSRIEYTPKLIIRGSTGPV